MNKQERVYSVLPKELKECNVCHWALPRSEFHRNCVSKDGLVGTCKLCAKERRQEWYKKNRQRLIEYSAEYIRTQHNAKASEKETQEKEEMKCERCISRGDQNPPDYKLKQPSGAPKGREKIYMICPKCNFVRNPDRS